MKIIIYFCRFLFLLTTCQGQRMSLQGSSFTAVVGESFQLTCYVTGGPDPPRQIVDMRRGFADSVCYVHSDFCGVSLRKNDSRYTCGAFRCDASQPRVYFLNISRLTFEDDTEFWDCEYNNRHGVFTLHVNYKPSISGIPNPYNVIEKTNLWLNCSTYTQSNPAVSSYRWSGPGDYNSSGPILSITNITRDKTGEYTCTANNTLTTSNGSTMTGTGSSSIHVEVQPQPPCVALPASINVTEFTRLQINCSAYTTRGNPSTTTYKWTFPDGNYSEDPMLSIRNISRDMSGQYTCTAINSLIPTNASRSTGSSTGIVWIDAQYTDSPVLILNKTEVMENDTLDISCDVVSNPTVQMTITNTDNNTVLVKQTTNNKQITINRVQCLHNGTYVCSANNRDINTEMTSSRSLSVLCSPRHDSRVALNNIITKNMNETAVLIADFISNPSPNFTWYRYSNGTSAAIGSNIIHKVIKDEYQTRLQISIKKSSDYGDYVVVAQNTIGQSEIKFTLTALESPSHPEDIYVSMRSHTFISLKWMSSFNGGAAQIFRLSYRPQDSSSWSISGDIQDPGWNRPVSTNITGLSAGTKYTIQLYAENKFGSSPVVTINVTTRSVDSQSKPAAYSMTGVIVGCAAGGLAILAIVAGGLIFCRKGYRCRCACSITIGDTKTNREQVQEATITNSAAAPDEAVYDDLAYVTPVTYDALRLNGIGHARP